jgi:IS605 OrfB family transposase
MVCLDRLRAMCQNQRFPHQRKRSASMSVSKRLPISPMAPPSRIPVSSGRREKNLAKAQRKRDKAPQKSQERKKRNKRCARIHERTKNRRKNFAHQESHKIVKQHGLIAVEALVVRNMVKNPKLAKSIADASWSLFFTHLQAKAEEAGRMLVRVDPAYTSQRCSCCVTPVKGHHLSGERSPTSSGNGSMPNVSLAPEREVKNHSMTLERESDGSSRSERLSGQSRHGES